MNDKQLEFEQDDGKKSKVSVNAVFTTVLQNANMIHAWVEPLTLDDGIIQGEIRLNIGFLC